MGFCSSDAPDVKFPTAKNIVDLRNPLEQKIAKTQQQYFLDLMNSPDMGYQAQPSYNPLNVYLNSIQDRGGLVDALSPSRGSMSPWGGLHPGLRSMAASPMSGPMGFSHAQLPTNEPVGSDQAMPKRANVDQPSFNPYQLLGPEISRGVPQPSVHNQNLSDGTSSVNDTIKKMIDAVLQSTPQLFQNTPASDGTPDAWRFQSG